MMDLKHYQQLQQHSMQNPQLLGCKLPAMQLATLSSVAIETTIAAVKVAVAALAPSAGWYMVRDKIVITTELPARNDLIEGEWFNGESTIKAKLLYGDQYLLTTMEQSPKATNDHAYTEQRVILRGDLQTTNERNIVTYRQWWQRDTDPNSNLGRWSPFVQQFIGYHWSQQVAEQELKP